MIGTVLTDFFAEPPFCEREILRYSGCRSAGGEIISLVNESISEAKDVLSYRTCRREFSLKITGGTCDFVAFSIKSDGLAKNLEGCEKAVIFAATVGVGIDRLIAKYSKLSPAKALVLQALGAERVEALCDALCERIESEYNCGTKPRFSPGYGDLPLECQKEIFSVLDCERKIGLTLNSSLLMSPSKSVTAFVGLCKSESSEKINKCAACDLSTCEFRGGL